MGAVRSRLTVTIAAKHAANIGSNSVNAAVISMTSTIPVIGACTTPVKNAAMPTKVKAAGSTPRSGKIVWHNAPQTRPSCAPSTNNGANSPPGVRAA